MSYEYSPVTIMSRRDVSFESAMYAGQASIAMHDQAGFPYDLSFEMFKERDQKVCVLGCMLEAAARKWPKAAVRRMLLCLCEIYPNLSGVRAWAGELNDG